MSEVTEQYKAPNPGSDKAIISGCTCPVLDNGRGRGCRLSTDGTPMFWISGDCPLHAKSTTTRKDINV